MKWVKRGNLPGVPHRALIVAGICMLMGVAVCWIAFDPNNRLQTSPLPSSPVNEVVVRPFTKTYTARGDRAEMVRRLFSPARRGGGGTKWMYWGSAEFKFRNGESQSVSLFLVKDGQLGVFEVNKEFFLCDKPDQLNVIVDLAKISVDRRLVPIE